MGKVSSVRFQGYKSFSDDNAVELLVTPAISVLIGKNNSGKSSCLDALECVLHKNDYFKSKKYYGKISVSFFLDERDISYSFNKNYSGGDIEGNNYLYGAKFIGKKIYEDLAIKVSGRDYYLDLRLSDYQTDLELPIGKDEWINVSRTLNDYQNNYSFRRINADRNIFPEEESSDEKVGYSGEGATNILRKFINHNQYDEKVVEEILLRELNVIMAPDNIYEKIRVQQIEDGELIKWEIFLEEKDGRRFALSKSGSGLKTIILMLINLYVIPELREYSGKQLIYAFEELENNLHPALQRRVFEYLYNYAIKKNVNIFLTTHSHIAINTYYEKNNVAIYHVQKDEHGSVLNSVKDRETRLDVIADLDVRASDLFQSNGIIWVEGPSDRIYINRWLQVFCDSKYIEGSHYQFMYYGGKVLSNYSADIEAQNDLINILTTNQNAAIVIDSDRTQKSSRINTTKIRIREEFSKIKAFCWITQRKEIENYIPANAINAKYETNFSRNIKQYELFPDYIAKIEKNFTQKKVSFARGIIENITYENSKEILDLEKKIIELYETIKKWNRNV